MPVGAVRLLEYRARFAALGLPRSYAWHRSLRAALVTTRLELFPRKVLSGMQTVIDVGANVGAWSCGIASLTGASRIIAFEPVPETFNILRRNTRRYPAIECVSTAVGRPNQAAMNFFVETTTELSSARPLTVRGRAAHQLPASPSRSIEVPVVALDEALRHLDEITVLKIDVQGGELDVLAGAGAVLQRTRLLIVEALYRRDYYEGAATFDELYEHITATTPLRLWTMSEPGIAPDGTPMWADAIFVRDAD
jgi:FkbM family methyltransferase